MADLGTLSLAVGAMQTIDLEGVSGLTVDTVDAEVYTSTDAINAYNAGGQLEITGSYPATNVRLELEDPDGNMDFYTVTVTAVIDASQVVDIGDYVFANIPLLGEDDRVLIPKDLPYFGDNPTISPLGSEDGFDASETTDHFIIRRTASTVPATKQYTIGGRSFDVVVSTANLDQDSNGLNTFYLPNGLTLRIHRDNIASFFGIDPADITTDPTIQRQNPRRPAYTSFSYLSTTESFEFLNDIPGINVARIVMAGETVYIKISALNNRGQAPPGETPRVPPQDADEARRIRQKQSDPLVATANTYRPVPAASIPNRPTRTKEVFVVKDIVMRDGVAQMSLTDTRFSNEAPGKFLTGRAFDLPKLYDIYGTSIAWPEGTSQRPSFLKSLAAGVVGGLVQGAIGFVTTGFNPWAAGVTAVATFASQALQPGTRSVGQIDPVNRVALPERRVFGEERVIAWEFFAGTRGDTLDVLAYISSGEIEQIKGIFINGQYIELGSDGRPVQDSQFEERDKLRVTPYIHAATGPALEQYYSRADVIWRDAYHDTRVDPSETLPSETSYVHIELDNDDNFWSERGAPVAFEFAVLGDKVEDLSQYPNHETATKVYTDNSVAIRVAVEKEVYGEDDDNIEWHDTLNAYNIAEAELENDFTLYLDATGTVLDYGQERQAFFGSYPADQRKYPYAGQILSTDSPIQVRDILEIAANGFSITKNGKLSLFAQFNGNTVSHAIDVSQLRDPLHAFQAFKTLDEQKRNIAVSFISQPDLHTESELRISGGTDIAEGFTRVRLDFLRNEVAVRRRITQMLRDIEYVKTNDIPHADANLDMWVGDLVSFQNEGHRIGYERYAVIEMKPSDTGTDLILESVPVQRFVSSYALPSPMKTELIPADPVTVGPRLHLGVVAADQDLPSLSVGVNNGDVFVAIDDGERRDGRRWERVSSAWVYRGDLTPGSNLHYGVIPVNQALPTLTDGVSDGDIFLAIDDGTRKDGRRWVRTSGAWVLQTDLTPSGQVTAGATRPADPALNALHIDADGEIFRWDGSDWIDTGVDLTGAAGARVYSGNVASGGTPSVSGTIPTDSVFIATGMVEPGRVWRWDGSAWQSEGTIRGEKGDTGLSSRELTVYRLKNVGANNHATPTGGSYDYSADSLTAPNNWSRTFLEYDPRTQEVQCSIATAFSDDTLSAWSPVRICNAEGDINLVYIRQATTPTTPAAGTNRVPTGWSDTPPSGDAQLWASDAHRPAQSGTWSFGTPFKAEGEDGDDGVSYREKTIYRKVGLEVANGNPPTGGSYVFSTDTLTAPTGWSEAFPAYNSQTEKVLCTIATGTSNNTLSAWSAVRACASEGDLNIIFQRADTKPGTPANTQNNTNNGVPTGWVDNEASTTGTDTLWSSVGHRDAYSNTWVWTAPVQHEGQDGATGNAGVIGYNSPLRYNRILTATGETGRVGASPGFNEAIGQYKFKQASSLTAQGYNIFRDIDDCTFLDIGVPVGLDITDQGGFQTLLEWLEYVAQIQVGTLVVLYINANTWMAFEVTSVSDNGGTYSVGGTDYITMSIGISHRITTGPDNTQIGNTDSVVIGTSLPGRAGKDATGLPGYNIRHPYDTRILTTSVPDTLGEYQLIDGTDRDLSTLAELADADSLLFYGPVGLNADDLATFLSDTSQGLNTGTIITLWESDDKWIAYRVTSVLQTPQNTISVGLSHILTNGTGSIAADADVNLLMNIAGIDGPEGLPGYNLRLPYTARSDSADPDALGEYRFLDGGSGVTGDTIEALEMSDTLRIYAPASVMMSDIARFMQSLELSLNTGTVVTLWDSDTKWIAFRINTITGPSSGNTLDFAIEHVRSMGLGSIADDRPVQLLFNVAGVDGQAGLPGFNVEYPYTTRILS